MSIRSFAADLLPAALHGLARPPVPVPVAHPEVSTFAALSEKLGYLSKSDLKNVREAYKFADQAHLGQLRASGIPYITHPLAVAGLVADWQLDAQALIAALTHDTMEDCGVTKSELIERFGAPTADLVDGLTKLDKLQFSTREEGQAESFRKMLLAMSRDVRVILIKLCDRLHNMRTMDAMAANKRARIARETIEIFAPIAHRLGLNQMYRELQDLSFRFMYPWRYAAVAKALERARGTRRDIVDRMKRDVEKSFAEARTKVTVYSREKTVFSIYTKMREKHAGFAAVNDIFGFRIVVHTLPECYLSLGTLHQMYKPVPGRFKDYIAIPKANGYQSLHTTLVNPLGTAVEFQLRTEEMHAVAEAGIAAHWMYKATTKDGAAGPRPDEAQRLGAMWLQSLIDIQSETRDSSEFLEHIKIDLFPEAVYVFTPKSKILALPRGATPIDFAYAIHSDVGDHCVAAKVNGEPVALRTELKSGDVVEVSTSANARPNPSWLNSVRTGRARSKIRHFLKNLEQEESIALGEKLLAQALRSEGLSVPADDEAHAPLWQTLTRWAGSRTRAELMVDIGLGRKIASIVAKRLAQLIGDRDRGARPDAVALTMGRYADSEAQAGPAVIEIDGSEGASVQLAHCCRPIPGDEVAGYFGGEGLTVHTTDCSIGRRLKERDGERWMDVDWADALDRSFEANVGVLVHNTKGALAQVAQAISAAEADITHIDMGDERAAESTELNLLVSVRDRLHLADVLRTLKRAPSVMRAGRVKP